MGFAFLTTDPSVIIDYMNSYTKLKAPDCSFFTKDGNEIPLHKELLFQTKFMRSLAKSIDYRSQKLEIIFPSLSIEDLDAMVEFLYTGQISCTDSNHVTRLISNLQDFLGFPNFMDVTQTLLDDSEKIGEADEQFVEMLEGINTFENDDILEKDSIDFPLKDSNQIQGYS